jgi:WW domain-binding protein 2
LTLAWFSANAFVATITPVKDGGIPHFAELKLTFKEGGAFEFYNTYTALLDRLHAQDDGRPVEHLEDLPMYSNENTHVQEETSSPPPPPMEDDEDAEELPTDLPPSYDDVASDEGQRGRTRTRH